jgi:glutathione S-transferase
VAGARFQMVYLGRSKAEREPLRVERGEQALGFMDSALKDRGYLAADHMTIADIALLAYTRLAGEGGFDLAARPHVKNWIGCCEQELGLAPVGSA